MERIRIEIKFFEVRKAWFAQLETVLKVEENGGTRWISVYTKEGVEITFFEEK